MYDNILNKPLQLKPNISNAARHLLEGLLQKDRTKRLGCTDDFVSVVFDRIGALNTNKHCYLVTYVFFFFCLLLSLERDQEPHVLLPHQLGRTER